MANLPIGAVLTALIAICAVSLAGLIAATSHWGARRPDDIQARTLEKSSCIERMITAELEYHSRLNEGYPPPAPGLVDEAGAAIYGDIRELARHYVEERDRLLGRHDEILRNDGIMSLLCSFGVANIVLHVMTTLAVFLAFLLGELSLWLIVGSVVVPWLIFILIYAAQCRRMLIYTRG